MTRVTQLAFFAAIALAQDTRHVIEPTIPPVCATLEARLAAPLSDPDENKPDTSRIQNAIDNCALSAGAHSVALRADGGLTAFLTGPLQLRSGITLLVDRGAIVFASRNPRDYDLAPGRCGTVDDKGRACKPLISGDRTDSAAVMGDGAIDGRGGARLLGSKDSWWDLAQEAKVKNLYQNCPRLIVISHSTNFTLYRIALKNSPNFHVTFNGDGFTAWGVVIDAPKTSRNTDGIDPLNATNVTIAHSNISTGDDQVAIKANSSGPSSHFTIAHNRFYSGHGMSIGSETDGGVSAIRVIDLSIDGADNGLRIKSNASRGGLVEDVLYEDVCIQNTKNPIFMDSNYTASVGPARNKIPLYTGIVFRDVRVLTPGKITLDGFDEAHRLALTFDNVILSNPSATAISARHAAIALGPGPVNFLPTGDDVGVDGKSRAGRANSCAEKFERMPKR